MAQVGDEAVPLSQVPCEGLEYRQIELLVLAADLAHEVLVGRLVGALVLRPTVVKMGVADKPAIFEYFEGAIDGGDVDVRKLRRYLAVDLIHRDVATHRGHDVQNELALRRHAQPMLLERAP